MAPPTTPWPRDIQSTVSGVQNSFSSWDNCMAQSYCKYPVIAGIIVASLIVLSLLFCIIRCACCGLECCCGCLSCCNACCPSPRGKKNKGNKYDDGPPGYGANPYQGAGGGGGYGGGYQPTYPPSYNPPAQYAQFDASSKVHADSLPAMPSWDTASSRKIPDDTPHHHRDDDAGAVEMDHMTPNEEQEAPMLAHQAPPPSDPHTAYGVTHPDSFDNPDAFVAAAPSPYQPHSYHSSNLADPYSQQDRNDPLQRYAGGGGGSGVLAAAAIAPGSRASTASPYSRQSSYRGGPAAYGAATPSPQPPPQSYRGSPHGQQAGYAGGQQQSGATGRAMSPPAAALSSPAPPRGAGLPGALMAGRGTPQPLINTSVGAGNGSAPSTPGGYRAYSPPSVQAAAAPAYAAYTPGGNQGHGEWRNA